MIDKIIKSDAEWRAKLTPRAVQGRAQEGHRARVHRRVLGQPRGTACTAACAAGRRCSRSDTKFESGTGWPSFWAPVAPENSRANATTRACSCGAPKSSAPRATRTSATSVRRRPGADRPALLPELGGARVRAQGLTRAGAACTPNPADAPAARRRRPDDRRRRPRGDWSRTASPSTGCGTAAPPSSRSPRTCTTAAARSRPAAQGRPRRARRDARSAATRGRC